MKSKREKAGHTSVFPSLCILISEMWASSLLSPWTRQGASLPGWTVTSDLWPKTDFHSLKCCLFRQLWEESLIHLRPPFFWLSLSLFFSPIFHFILLPFPSFPLSPSFLLYIYSCRVEWSQDRNNVRLCTVRNSPAGRACSQRSGARTDWASLFLLSNPAMPITWWQRGCSRQRRPRFQLRIPRLHPIRKLFFSERCFLPWKRDRKKRKEAWVLVPCWEQVRWFLCRHFVNGKYCKDADGRY